MAMAMESHPHPSTLQTRIRDEKVVLDIDVPVPIRIKQTHLPSQISENGRERHVDFRERQIHTDALPRPSAEIKQILLPRFFLPSQEP